MAIRRLNFQSVLFLKHEIQELLFKYDDIYISLQKLSKIYLETENCKNFAIFVWLRIDCCHDNYLFKFAKCFIAGSLYTRVAL